MKRQVKRMKQKTHKGLAKRLIISKGGLRMKRVGSNKYAHKRSNRNRRSRGNAYLKVTRCFRSQIKSMMGKYL